MRVENSDVLRFILDGCLTIFIYKQCKTVNAVRVYVLH